MTKTTSLLLWAVVITLFGGWLRMTGLTQHPTWWDEHASLFSATGQIARQGDAFDGRVSSAASNEPKVSPAQMGNSIRVGCVLDLHRVANVPAATLFWDRGNGLAFNFLLHFWVRIFGAEDAALRSLPWLLGTLAIPAVFILALQAGGGLTAAAVSSGLVAANALLVEFAREVRPYSMAVLLGLTASSLFLGLARPDAPRWLAAGYVASVATLAFTHYLAVPVILGAHAVASVFSPARRRLLIVVGLAVAVIALALTAWMAWGGRLGMAAMAEHDRIWLARAREGILWWLQPFHWPDALRLAVERPMQMNWPGLQFWPLEHPWAGAAVIVWLMVAVFGFWQWWCGKGSKRAQAALLILAISAGSLFSLALSWKSGHTLPFLNRYFTFYVPFQILAVGLAVAGCVDAARRWTASVPALVILAAGIFLMLGANLQAALQPKPKASFSFDAAVEKASPGARVACDGLDSALVFALKAGPKHRETQLILDPSAPSPITITHE